MRPLNQVMTESTRRRVTRLAYRTQQTGIRIPSIALGLLLRLGLSRSRERPSAATITRFRSEYDALLEADLANVEAGLYPARQLFQVPWGTYARTFPRWLRGLPDSFSRAHEKHFKDLPADVPLDRYPAYYRRNFHWQSDGYFSEDSARTYDIGVEILFGGAADVMRRQIIPPIAEHLRAYRQNGGAAPRVLDIACGTGRGLVQLTTAFPDLRYTGLDLSPYYLKEAQRQLADVADVSFVADNAEALPFRDASQDIITSIYLFHELPRRARRNVYREMLRVLKPGGLLVIEDSAQLSEASDIEFFLRTFPQAFHEPYYLEYIADPMEDALAEVGFETEAPRRAFASKVVVARKPAAV